MTNVQAHVYPTTSDLEYDGYAEFNNVPHLAVDVPDGGFTITAKTSEGKRITFSFMPYRDNGPPQCVDVQYHDNGTVHAKNGIDIPDFNVLLFGETKARAVMDQYDSRKQPFRPSIVCVLIDNEKETKK